ncbi:MAG: peptide chain release factor N(5)-glutamine methyltransferase [Elusimicrobia bacterium]|nr:peptide chain release factor N(5)-glutamine methyltransferase [Elusimicrobiota bacterium]
MTPTIGDGIKRATQRLSDRGVSNAEREALELVARAAAFSKDTLPARLRDPLSPEASIFLDQWTVRRVAGTPLAHLIGEWDFLDFTVTVTPDVLIPRPETEGLFDWAVRASGSPRSSDGAVRASGSPRSSDGAVRARDAVSGAKGPAHWVDCGTGSGVLALAAARQWTDARVTAIDLSAAALAVARWNARRLGVENRIQFRQGDLLDGIDDQSVDGLLANLPYVEDGEWSGLATEVRQEPRRALLGGSDGLDVIRRFVPQAARVLRSGGAVYLEVGRGQAEAVAALLRGSFSDVRLEKDFAGIDRYVGGVR